MKVANIGEFKNNLSKFIGFVEQGEVVQICKHNVPVAKLVPHESKKTIRHISLTGKECIRLIRNKKRESATAESLKDDLREIVRYRI